MISSVEASFHLDFSATCGYLNVIVSASDYCRAPNGSVTVICVTALRRLATATSLPKLAVTPWSRLILR